MEQVSQLFFQKILNQLSDALFIVKIEEKSVLRYVFINQSGYEILGRLPDQVVGKTIREAFPDQPERETFISESYKKVIEQQQSIMYRDHFLGLGGETVYAETRLDPLFNEMGEMTHIVAVVRDITELVHQQEESKVVTNRLQETEHHYHSLIENNNDAVWFTSNEWELIRANEAFRNMLGVSSDTELRELRDITIKRFEPMEFEKVRGHQNLVLKGHPQEYESYFFRKDRSRIDVQVKAIPVFIDGKVQGLYGFAKDITAQKRVEKELHESEERYRKLIELSPNAIIVHQEGKIVYANPAANQVMHASEEESLLNRPIMEFVHPDDYDLVISRIKTTRIHKKTAELMEERFLTLDGEVIEGETVAVPVMYDGKHATQVIVRDITEKKQKELELQDVRNRLQLYWNHVSDAVFSIGYKGDIIDVNPAFTKMLGFSAEELRGQSVPPIFTEEGITIQQELLNSLQKGEEISNNQTIRKMKNGNLRTVLASYMPVQDETIAAIGLYKDVTDQVKIQQALEESEERYRSLFDYNKDAIWSLDLEKDFTSANQAFEKILGVSPESVTKMNLSDFEQAVITPFEDIIEHFEKVMQGKSVEYELSMYHLNGEVVHLTITNVPIYVEKQIIGLFGIGKDVTEEVHAKEALRASEKQYRLIAENMNDLIIVFDLDAIVTYASPSYQSVLGVKPEEYVGQPALSLVHEDDHPEISSRFTEAIQHQRSFTIEFRKRGPLGKWLFFETVCMPLFDDQNVLEGFVGTSRNINDRKYCEEKLEHLAFHDPLTNAPNRRLFEKLANQALKEAARSGQSLGTMYMDLDKFKSINDTLGHDIGDELLIQFRNRLKGNLRELGVLARMGGDEFTVLLPNMGRTEVDQFARRLLQTIQQPYQINGHTFTATSSMGIAIYPEHGKTIKELLQRADEAMYRAKEKGRNNFCVAEY